MSPEASAALLKEFLAGDTSDKTFDAQMQKRTELRQLLQARAGQLSTHDYGLIMRQFARASDLEVVMQLAALVWHQPHVRLDERACGCIIHACANAGASGQPLEPSRRMEVPPAMRARQAWEARRDHVKLALHVLRYMIGTGFTPDLWTFNAAVHVCARAERPDKAAEVVKSMKACEVKPDTVTYNSLMKAYFGSSQPDRVVQVLRDMRDNGVVPDVWSYTTAIKCCGGVTAALQLIKDMRQQNLKPNVYVYTAMIGVCDKVGNVDAIRQVISVMNDEGTRPDIVTYRAFVNSCQRWKNWRFAVEALNDMTASGIVPDKFVYDRVITTCVNSEQWSLVLDVYARCRAAEHNVNKLHLLAARAAANLDMPDVLAEICKNCSHKFRKGNPEMKELWKKVQERKRGRGRSSKR